MGEVNLIINGKSYGIACDDGQESRVVELGKLVDTHVRSIAAAGAANNESHRLVLAGIMMADEIKELRDAVNQMQSRTAASPAAGLSPADERQIAEALAHLALRIDAVAGGLQTRQ